MPTDRFAIRQAEIALSRQEACRVYPTQWRTMTQAWCLEEDEDACWLTYSANYLLRTAGLRWAIDPLSLLTRAGGGEQPDFAADLAPLRLVVLTHAHADHLDGRLIASLQELPIRWVVPEFMLGRFLDLSAVPAETISIPQPGVPIPLGPLTLTPFPGLHLHDGHGVPAVGYLAEFAGQRWLFPGDTRRYELSSLPEFGRLDGVFAHLWLGRGGALDDPPAKLEEFCRFFAGLQAKKVVITHLHEYGRDADDYWDMRHYRLVEARLKELDATIQVSAACTGQKVRL